MQTQVVSPQHSPAPTVLARMQTLNLTSWQRATALSVPVHPTLTLFGSLSIPRCVMIYCCGSSSGAQAFAPASGTAGCLFKQQKGIYIPVIG